MFLCLQRMTMFTVIYSMYLCIVLLLENNAWSSISCHVQYQREYFLMLQWLIHDWVLSCTVCAVPCVLCSNLLASFHFQTLIKTWLLLGSFSYMFSFVSLELKTAIVHLDKTEKRVIYKKWQLCHIQRVERMLYLVYAIQYYYAIIIRTSTTTIPICSFF